MGHYAKKGLTQLLPKTLGEKIAFIELPIILVVLWLFGFVEIHWHIP